MKKKIFYFVASLLFALFTISANASSDTKAIKEKVNGMTDTQKEERITEIQHRVEEIKAMDKSKLTKVERKDLRNELKDMNREAKAAHGRTTIIIGGLVIIILLLILIL
jgi:hypothetical protein